MSKLHAVQKVVGGRFQLIRLLGTGGQAEVHLAKDLDLGIDVVLKSQSFADASHLGLLRREARVLMEIVPHRGLPTFRNDLIDGDHYVLINDYVDGRDLQSVLASQGDPGLAVQTVLGYLDQVAATLDHLHGHSPSLVHGDIKPANLVLADDGRVVIIDFGSAARVGELGEGIGTSGFAAPEMVAGEAITAAVDVFALAAVAITLLTGTTPTAGAPMWDGLRAAQADGLERVLRRALAFDPSRRPASASELVSQLRQAAEMDIPNGTVTIAYFGCTTGSTVRSDIANQVESAGGRMLATATVPDDGVAAAFTRVRDAACAAMSILATNGGQHCTVGLHVGDLGGWHGATLQQLVGETIQLTQGVPVGSATCSPPTRMLLGREGTHHFVPATYGFRVSPVRPDRSSIGAPETERWISSRRVLPIVGRDEELDAVRAAVDYDHRHLRASMVVLTADPGMGKSRILAELGARAVSEHHRVLVGQCTRAASAFEPFVDALGEEAFNSGTGQIEGDEEGWMDRRRFFARVAAVLQNSDAPVTLIIDDLHLIDGASTALLAHLLGQLGPNLTVLAGCRRDESPRGFVDLLNRFDVQSIRLDGLRDQAIGRLAQICDVALVGDGCGVVGALTGGNPFFALQFLEHLSETPATDSEHQAFTNGVLDWVSRRIVRLEDDVRAVLGPAAVIGLRFDVRLLAEVLGADPLEVLTHLEQAVAAGLLIEGDHAGEFRFVHTLVRTSLLDGLSPTRRALLHAKLAERLEAGVCDVDVLELAAHHWLEAGTLGNPVHPAEAAGRVTHKVFLHA